MTLLEVDPQFFRSLDEKERTRLADGLLALGVMVNDCQRLYTDEVGRVVGALRVRRDEDGNLLGGTEHVGLVP